MSETIIRAGDIEALSQAVETLSSAVAELSRQNQILAEGQGKLHERITKMEGNNDPRKD